MNLIVDVPDGQAAGPVHAPVVLALGQIPRQAKVANAAVVALRHKHVAHGKVPMHDAQLYRHINISLTWC